MIKNRLIDQILCLDQNTVVLDLRAVNDDYVTHIIIDRKTAQKLSESLEKWAEGGNNESN